MRALALLLLAGCADHDLCAGYDGTCIGLRVNGSGSVDQLQVHVTGAAKLDGNTPPTPSVPHTLPVTTALFLSHASGPFAVTVAGLLGGAGVGEASANTQLKAGQHLNLPVTLSPPGNDLAMDLAASDLAGSDLAGVDLAGVDLAGRDLAGDDLSSVDLGGVPDLASQDLSGPQPRYLFLLPARSSALGTHGSLDVDCQNAAAASLPNVAYKAVIAYPPADNPADYLSLTQHRDILRPDGTKIATDDNFFSATISHLAPIDELADGTTVSSGCAYTNFGFTGLRISSPSDCNGWSDATNAFNGTTGDVKATDTNWSFQTPILSCDQLSCHVYCIQQD